MSGLMLGAIATTLRLDSSDFRTGMLQAEAQTRTFGASITTAMVSPLLAALDAMKQLAKFVAENTKNQIDLAEGIDRVSKATSMSTDMIQTLQIAGQNAGLSIETMNNAMLALGTRMGDARKDGGALVKTFESLGVTIKGTESIDEIVFKIADAIMNAKDETQALALAAEAFGRGGGAAMVAVLRAGSAELDAFGKKQELIGNRLTSKQLGTLLAADNNLDLIGNMASAAKKQNAVAAADGALAKPIDEKNLRDSADAMKLLNAATTVLAIEARNAADNTLGIAAALKRLDSNTIADLGRSVQELSLEKRLLEFMRRQLDSREEAETTQRSEPQFRTPSKPTTRNQ